MRNQEGQLLPLGLGLLIVVVAVAGLGADFTRLFLARRSLQSVADAASLRAAGQLDEAALYSSSGSSIKVLPERARVVALEVIRLRGLPGRPSIAIEGERVTIALQSEIPTTLLRLVGIESLPVSVASTAIPVEGVP